MIGEAGSWLLMDMKYFERLRKLNPIAKTATNTGKELEVDPPSFLCVQGRSAMVEESREALSRHEKLKKLRRKRLMRSEKLSFVAEEREPAIIVPEETIPNTRENTNSDCYGNDSDMTTKVVASDHCRIPFSNSALSITRRGIQDNSTPSAEIDGTEERDQSLECSGVQGEDERLIEEILSVESDDLPTPVLEPLNFLGHQEVTEVIDVVPGLVNGVSRCTSDYQQEYEKHTHSSFHAASQIDETSPSDLRRSFEVYHAAPLFQGTTDSTTQVVERPGESLDALVVPLVSQGEGTLPPEQPPELRATTAPKWDTSDKRKEPALSETTSALNLKTNFKTHISAPTVQGMNITKSQHVQRPGDSLGDLLNESAMPMMGNSEWAAERPPELVMTNLKKFDTFDERMQPNQVNSFECADTTNNSRPAAEKAGHSRAALSTDINQDDWKEPHVVKASSGTERNDVDEVKQECRADQSIDVDDDASRSEQLQFDGNVISSHLPSLINLSFEHTDESEKDRKSPVGSFDAPEESSQSVDLEDALCSKVRSGGIDKMTSNAKRQYRGRPNYSFTSDREEGKIDQDALSIDMVTSGIVESLTQYLGEVERQSSTKGRQDSQVRFSLAVRGSDPIEQEEGNAVGILQVGRQSTDPAREQNAYDLLQDPPCDDMGLAKCQSDIPLVLEVITYQCSEISEDVKSFRDDLSQAAADVKKKGPSYFFTDFCHGVCFAA